MLNFYAPFQAEKISQITEVADTLQRDGFSAGSAYKTAFFSVAPEYMLEENSVFSIGEYYDTVEQKDGKFAVLDMPVFQTTWDHRVTDPNDPYSEYTEQDLLEFVRNHQYDQHTNKRLPVVHVWHHDRKNPTVNREFAGHLANVYTKVWKGALTVFGDHINIPPHIFQNLMEGKYPYRSPEINLRKRKFASMAVLESVEPFFDHFPIALLRKPIKESAMSHMQFFSENEIDIDHIVFQFESEPPEMSINKFNGTPNHNRSRLTAHFNEGGGGDQPPAPDNKPADNGGDAMSKIQEMLQQILGLLQNQNGGAGAGPGPGQPVANPQMQAHSGFYIPGAPTPPPAGQGTQHFQATTQPTKTKAEEETQRQLGELLARQTKVEQFQFEEACKDQVQDLYDALKSQNRTFNEEIFFKNGMEAAMAGPKTFGIFQQTMFAQTTPDQKKPGAPNMPGGQTADQRQAPEVLRYSTDSDCLQVAFQAAEYYEQNKDQLPGTNKQNFIDGLVAEFCYTNQKSVPRPAYAHFQQGGFISPR